MRFSKLDLSLGNLSPQMRESKFNFQLEKQGRKMELCQTIQQLTFLCTWVLLCTKIFRLVLNIQVHFLPNVHLIAYIYEDSLLRKIHFCIIIYLLPPKKELSCKFD